ncbi:MAG: sensor histidine kinase [Clostridia bacterium]|nr:sensor histidine kinase [Clostridia bacterium]
MSGKKSLRLVRQFWLPASALILLAAFLFLCRGRVQTKFPVLEPTDGVLDARDVDFTEEVYHIVNRWDYWPGVLLTPEELASPEAPQKNNDADIDDRLGTWHLELLAEPRTYLTLCSFSIDYGTRVYVNGREVRNIGCVSDDPSKAKPMMRYMTLPLYSGEDGRIEIVYQYSNFIHNDGGFIQNTLISTPENIDEYQRGLSLWAILLGGGLIFFAFNFLLGAAFQKSREYVALALCCAVIALRNQFFFGEHLLPAGFDFIMYYRLLVLDATLIPVSSLFLFRAFFPQVRGRYRGEFFVFTAIFAVLAACHFIVGTKQLVTLCYICCFVCIPFLFIYVYRFIRHFRKERMTALDALTLTAIALLIVMLIYEGLNTGSNSTLNHFGVTPAAMVVCILILNVVINTRQMNQAVLLRETTQRNELLGQVNDMNRDFLRTVAHELKTPLTVISGYAQLMGRQLEKGSLADSAPQRLDTIRQEADRLAEIVMRLMDYTYGANREAEFTAVDVAALFESAGAVLRPVCAKRGNTLTFPESCGFCVHGNFELLLQVLINLVVNASRHTQNGVIAVEVGDGGGEVVFRVRDNGEGIAPDVAPHIFEKGFTTTNGQGLGLAICSESVTLHGGTLELESTGPEGSCFRFTVPKEEEQ